MTFYLFSESSRRIVLVCSALSILTFLLVQYMPAKEVNAATATATITAFTPKSLADEGSSPINCWMIDRSDGVNYGFAYNNSGYCDFPGDCGTVAIHPGFGIAPGTYIYIDGIGKRVNGGSGPSSGKVDVFMDDINDAYALGVQTRTITWPVENCDDPPPSSPPPPSISPCPNGNNGVPHVRISWNSGNNPGGTTGYIADLDDDNWSGGHWNRDSGGATSVTAPDNFNFYPPPGGGISLSAGATYQTRIYYLGPGIHSQTASFTAPSCTSSGGGNGHLQGRIFRDDNNDGSKQGSEPFIGTCGGLNIDVSVSAAGDTRNADICSPPGEPLYKIAAPPGNHTLTLNVPSGYVANINGTTRNANVSSGRDTDVGPWFGVREGSSTGNVQGRVFNDTNGNGVWNGGEQIIESPGANCTGSPRRALGSVNITVGSRTSTPNQCAPDGGVGPGTFGYYKISSSTGSVSVSLSVPSGWTATTSTSYTVNVNAGSDTNAPWFGIRPADQPATGTVNNVNCTQIRGRASDPDRPGDSVQVRIYKDAPASDPPAAGFPVTISTDSSGNFTFSTAEDADLSTHRYYVYVLGERPDGTPSGDNPALTSGNPTASTGVCGSVTCGTTWSTTPDPVELGSSYGVNVTFIYTGGNRGAKINSASHGAQVSIATTPPQTSAADYSDVTPTPTGTFFTARTSNTAFTANAPGAFRVTWRHSTGANCGSPSDIIEIVSRPYALVHGSDVVAGGGMDDNPDLCGLTSIVAPSSKQILGFTKSSPFVGSGVQFAAMAIGSISGFNSAVLRTSAPTADRGLTLANTSSPLGSFSHSRCIPNYFTGELNSSSVAIDRQPGDRVISSNTHSAGPGGVGYYIATGNLYIHKNVRRLEGVYIAQNIYTCVANAGPYPGNLVAVGDLFTECNNRLEVHGALIAVGDGVTATNGKLYLLRTHGTVGDARPQESPSTLVRPCTNSGALPLPKAVCAGEYITFNPAIYTAPGPIKKPMGNRYDALLSLPPVL